MFRQRFLSDYGTDSDFSFWLCRQSGNLAGKVRNAFPMCKALSISWVWKPHLHGASQAVLTLSGKETPPRGGAKEAEFYAGATPWAHASHPPLMPRWVVSWCQVWSCYYICIHGCSSIWFEWMPSIWISGCWSPPTELQMCEVRLRKIPYQIPVVCKHWSPLSCWNG